jgi:hypothetical protein
LKVQSIREPIHNREAETMRDGFGSVFLALPQAVDFRDCAGRIVNLVHLA